MRVFLKLPYKNVSKFLLKRLTSEKFCGNIGMRRLKRVQENRRGDPSLHTEVRDTEFFNQIKDLGKIREGSRWLSKEV